MRGVLFNASQERALNSTDILGLVFRGHRQEHFSQDRGLNAAQQGAAQAIDRGLSFVLHSKVQLRLHT